MESVLTKFEKLKRWTDTIRKIEVERSRLKATMNVCLHAQCLSVNSIVSSVIKWQRRIHILHYRLSNLHHLHNETWENLKYEDKVRYRYWANGEEFPGFEAPDLEQQPETPSDRPEDQNVPSKEPNEWRPGRRYFKIDRPNARKLCSKLIEFLSSQEDYFKVGFDETNAG
jgi:hypothetical protein